MHGCAVWDRYRAYQKLWLEQVQRRAALFVTRMHTKGPKEEGCVTKAPKQLNWRTLEKRRQVARLTLMNKCVTNQAAIDIPCYVNHQPSLKKHPHLIHWNLFHLSHPVTHTANTASGRELSLTGIACHLIIFKQYIHLQNLKPPSLTTFFQWDVYPFRFSVFLFLYFLVVAL